MDFEQNREVVLLMVGLGFILAVLLVIYYLPGGTSPGTIKISTTPGGIAGGFENSARLSVTQAVCTANDATTPLPSTTAAFVSGANPDEGSACLITVQNSGTSSGSITGVTGGFALEAGPGSFTVPANAIAQIYLTGAWNSGQTLTGSLTTSGGDIPFITVSS